MQPTVLTLSFPNRRTIIRTASWFYIGTVYGPILAEFVPNSEKKVNDRWTYSFFIQPEDVPAALDICNFDARSLKEPTLKAIQSPVIESSDSIEVSGAGTTVSPIRLNVKYSSDDGNKAQGGTDGAVYADCETQTGQDEGQECHD